MTWTWKKLTFTAIGVVFGVVVLAAIAGWAYLNVPVPIQTPTATSTVPSTITVTFPSTVAGNDFSLAVENVYADLQTIRMVNTNLNPVLNQITSRIAQSNYAGIYSLAGAATSYAQEGTAAAKKLTADTQALGLSEQSITDQQVLAQTASMVAALKQYTPALSSYYATMLTALKTPSVGNVSALRASSQHLSDVNTQSLQPALASFFSLLTNIVQTESQTTASSTAKG